MATDGGRETLNNGRGPDFFPVSPMLIRTRIKGGFELYLKQGDDYVKYTSKGELFTDAHRDRLDELGVRHVYVPAGDRQDYASYLQDNLPALLMDEGIPVPDRTVAWYQASVDLAERVLDDKLSKPMNKARFARIQELLEASTRFFTTEGALKHIARFVGKGYKGHDHGLGTMVLTTFVLMTYDDCTEELLRRCSLGSMLHDLGKTTIPAETLARRPEDRSLREEEQVRKHPSAGVALCAGVALPQETLNCILFHHEREDGQGYPSGMAGSFIPFYVKVLRVCDSYDNLTRATPWRPAMGPFQALNAIRARKGEYDVGAIKRLIAVLADADITE